MERSIDTSRARWIAASLLGGALMLAAAGTASAQVVFEEDHLKCYQVLKDEAPAGSRLAELSNRQFGDESCKVRTRASFLCAPTVKYAVDGHFVENDPRGTQLESDFLCYKMKCDDDVKREILINDQFGERKILTRDAKLLCTPTFKVDWPNIACGDASAPACAGDCPQVPGLPPLVCAPAAGQCSCVPES